MVFDQETKGPTEADLANAKAFLMGATSSSGLTLYDHLTKVITRLLDERPRDPAVVFEDVSKAVKEAQLSDDATSDKIDKTAEVALAEIQRELYGRNTDDGENMMEESIESALPNLMNLLHYFEQAGIGLNREEIMRLQLAMKQLVDTFPLDKVRFWGKIFGTEQNYYVVEVEFRDGEEMEEAEEEMSDRDERRDEEEEGEEEAESVPKVHWRPAPEVPKEEKGSGCNKKTYFVCNDPGKTWTKLPLVTPQQIRASRKIRKFFTGNLNAPINSYPPFPGSEGNLLRAQISRISAGTLVSPLGFYQFDEEEEGAEEGIVRDNFNLSDEFSGLALQDMIEPSLNSWVHHSLHILPQGRCSWWNPAKHEEEETEEEGEDSPAPKPLAEPELGPPLLSPLSADHTVDGTPAWTVRATSRLIPQCAIAVISSNLWPGAHAICDRKFFENIYIGWGQKYSAENYSPPTPGHVMREYSVGPDVSEVNDPTPEDEAASQAAKQKAEETGEDAEEDTEEDD